jgi:hypothetical protein
LSECHLLRRPDAAVWEHRLQIMYPAWTGLTNELAIGAETHAISKT